MKRVSILFVCMGNICRSPLAEGIFRHTAAEAGLSDKFAIDSAGTGGWHEGDLYDSLASRGCVVCAPDLRNTGDLAG